MDNSISPVSSQPSGTVDASASSASTTATQPPAAPASSFSTSTQVKSLDDLKQKAPKVYKAMMEGIATNIVNEMHDHQEKMKELNRKYREDAEGNG